jgi:hypothetical protein
MIKLKVDGTGLFTRIRKTLENAVDVTGRLAASRLLNAIVLNTPIRTGYARSRWTIDYRKSYTVKYDVSNPSLLFSEFKYTISNDAPYIIYLNRGSSRQAPAFFIEATILSQGFKINNAVTSR